LRITYHSGDCTGFPVLNLYLFPKFVVFMITLVLIRKGRVAFRFARIVE
jgi:hypothetical protein